jgi:hypothetical protein
VFAQDFEDDARLWANLDISKSLSKRTSVQVVLQNRLTENLSRYTGYVTIAADHRLSKYFRLTAGYAAGVKGNDEQSYDNVQQLFGGFTVRVRRQNFLMQFRSLFQATAKAYSLFNTVEDPQSYSRNRLMLRYDLNKRWEIFASCELYVPLNYRYKYDYVSRTRSMAGLTHNLSKKQSITAFFILQHHLNYTRRSTRDFIYGVSYNIVL